MDSARGARIALERNHMPVRRLDKIERHLPRHVVMLHERPHPLVDGGMFHRLKRDRRALPRCEGRRVNRMCRDASVLADRITAKLPPLNILLRDPRLAKRQRR